ncbi:cobalamin biosynthesis protein [Chloroflexi bacterium TSY]|nr:cobalamin biosynthesis protein [Chloroflexi bacterium TSY]
MTSKIIIAGGFLGAGKTTLLLQTAQGLIKQGYRVGLITNDQGENLVDTALATHHEIPVTEVAGGCFCCRFPDLMKALHHLQESVHPDVILAEPVGSCTDLVATIVYPLQQYYADQFQLAPLTILFDAQRDLTEFSPEVAYLYHKQLAEADLLVLSKADLLSAAELEHQQTEMALLAPQAQLLTLSAQTGAGIEEWFAHVLDESATTHHPLELDYVRYGVAEAQLGWLNAQGVLVSREKPFQATAWATRLLEHLSKCWREESAAVAHVKLNLQTPGGLFKVSLTQTGGPLIWDRQTEEGQTDHVEFILNARVSTSPEQLEQTVRQGLEQIKPAAAARTLFPHFESFSPAPPQPTHRLVERL